MLEILIADAELELVPVSMQDDYAIRKISKEKGKNVQELLLDSNFMHSAIERHFPGESNRRGRPDIFHILLNCCLDSILNREGKLKVKIHTRNDKIIDINSSTRIPRSYNRFCGIMEKLLSKGSIESPDGEVLMSLRNGSVKEIIGDGKKTILLHPRGKKARLPDILGSGKEDIRVVIGGFSEGDFRSDMSGIGEKYSISGEELTIWIVAMECIVNMEILQQNA